MRKPNNSKDALEFIQTLDSIAIKKQKDEIARLRKSGDQMATVLSDLLQSDIIPCSISRGVIKSTLDKWNADPK